MKAPIEAEAPGAPLRWEEDGFKPPHVDGEVDKADPHQDQQHAADALNGAAGGSEPPQENVLRSPYEQRDAQHEGTHGGSEKEKGEEGGQKPTGSQGKGRDRGQEGAHSTDPYQDIPRAVGVDSAEGLAALALGLKGPRRDPAKQGYPVGQAKEMQEPHGENEGADGDA